MSAEYSAGHLPDLLDNESLVDVLTLCNFCILSNALDFRTYSFPNRSNSNSPDGHDLEKRLLWDYNEMSVVDREHCTYVRGLAHLLIDWISCHYDVILPHTQEPMSNFKRDFCGRYLLDQACAILNYKKLAQEDKVFGAKWCAFGDLERQINYVLHDAEGKWYGDWKAKRQNFRQYTSLSFGPMSFTITKKDKPLEFKGKFLVA